MGTKATSETEAHPCLAQMMFLLVRENDLAGAYLGDPERARYPPDTFGIAEKGFDNQRVTDDGCTGCERGRHFFYFFYQ